MSKETFILLYIAELLPRVIPMAVGFALILWGLRIFKFYIIVCGVFLGAVLGVTIGALIGTAMGDVGSVVTGAFAAGLCLAVVGGIVAWPLQKVFVFMISGFFVGSLGVTLTAAAGAPEQAWIPIGAVLFVFGGIVAVALYEHFIIVVMAFAGAQSIFNAIYSPGIRKSLGLSENPMLVLKTVYETFAEHIVAFLFIILLFVFFALYFQKIKVTNPDDNEYQKVEKWRFRRITYAYISLCLVTYVLLFYQEHYRVSLINSVLLFLGKDSPVGYIDFPSYHASPYLSNYSFVSYSIFGMNVISLPVLAILTFWFASWLSNKGYKYSFIPSNGLTKYLYFTVYGLGSRSPDHAIYGTNGICKIPGSRLGNVLFLAWFSRRVLPFVCFGAAAGNRNEMGVLFPPVSGSGIPYMSQENGRYQSNQAGGSPATNKPYRADAAYCDVQILTEDTEQTSPEEEG